MSRQFTNTQPLISGLSGQTTHTFCSPVSQGLSNSVSLIGKFASASNSGAYDNGLSYISHADQTASQNARVWDAQNSGKTVHWELIPCGGGSMRPYVQNTDVSTNCL